MSGKVLFACSKCFSRHPFESLSSGSQLCKGCRGGSSSSLITIKCNYCRNEFQASKGITSTVCKKCEANIKQYGKPTTCECCNIIAAFIGTKCQRCAHSEQKYGPPVSCDQCKQRCAFDRRDENKKINGKLLCYLCTASYKRALAKAQIVAEKDALRNSKKRTHEKVSSSAPSSSAKKPNPLQRSGSGEGAVSKGEIRQNNSGGGNGGGNGGNSNGGAGNFVGMMGTPAPLIDPNSSDHVVAMTQLKEKIAMLEKKVVQKDRELLDKDKLTTELKSKNFESEIQLRNKLKENERLADIKVDLLNKKIANLLKEVATLKKSNKKNGVGKDKDSISTKDSGGSSGTDSPITN